MNPAHAFVPGARPGEGFPWRVTDADRKTAALMSGYWANFVKSGNPNGPGLPDWPPYRSSDDPVMHLDATPSVSPGGGRRRYEFLGT